MDKISWGVVAPVYPAKNAPARHARGRNVMQLTRSGSNPKTVLVTFQFPATIWAETVDLVAKVDGTADQLYPMVYSRPDDAWEVTLEMPEGQAYDYAYLLNGREVCAEWQQAQEWPQGANHG
jgi:hypothetical protein